MLTCARYRRSWGKDCTPFYYAQSRAAQTSWLLVCMVSLSHSCNWIYFSTLLCNAAYLSDLSIAFFGKTFSHLLDTCFKVTLLQRCTQNCKLKSCYSSPLTNPVSSSSFLFQHQHRISTERRCRVGGILFCYTPLGSLGTSISQGSPDWKSRWEWHSKIEKKKWNQLSLALSSA